MIMASMNFLVKEKCTQFQLNMLKELNSLKVDGIARIWDHKTSELIGLTTERIDITVGITTYMIRNEGSVIYTKSNNIEHMHYDEELAARWIAKNALKMLNDKISYLTRVRDKLDDAIGDKDETETD